MRCNIDAKGKAVRLVGGLLALGAGGVVLGLLALGVIGGAVLTVVGFGLVLFGAFGIFEARAGWCAVRAMGIRTPL